MQPFGFLPLEVSWGIMGKSLFGYSRHGNCSHAVNFKKRIKLMPEISRFFGIIIRMYFNEHEPSHFHAYYQNREASYDIKTGVKIKGSLPLKIEKIIEKWARQYQKELLECWELSRQRKTPKKIKGADK